MSFAYHGNYCGPGWSAGKYQESVWDESVKPVDELDQLCMYHDGIYASAKQLEMKGKGTEATVMRQNADQMFVDAVNKNPSLKGQLASLGINVQYLTRRLRYGEHEDIKVSSLVKHLQSIGRDQINKKRKREETSYLRRVEPKIEESKPQVQPSKPKDPIVPTKIAPYTYYDSQTGKKIDTDNYKYDGYELGLKYRNYGILIKDNKEYKVGIDEYDLHKRYLEEYQKRKKNQEYLDKHKNDEEGDEGTCDGGVCTGDTGMSFSNLL